MPLWLAIWLERLTWSCLRRAFYRSWKNNNIKGGGGTLETAKEKILCPLPPEAPLGAWTPFSWLSNSGVGAVTSPDGMSSGSLLRILVLLGTRCQPEYHKLMAGRQAGRKSVVIKLSLVHSRQAQSTQERYRAEAAKTWVVRRVWRMRTEESTEGPIFARNTQF